MAETFDITARHPQYEEYIDAWRLMRHAYEGEDEIKEHGTEYLPMKSGIKAIADVARREAAYDAYRDRAEFPEIVAPTIRGLMGVVHNKASEYLLPSGMEYLMDMATRDGQTLEQVHHKITNELLRVGRYGLLPGIKDSGEFHIAGYDAECITNWDGESYLVLNETHDRRDPDTNKWGEVKQYRECQLDDAGNYVSRIWTGVRGQDGKVTFVPGIDEFATIKGGAPLQEMPFVFAGCIDTTPDPDDIPLYGLAKLAVRAYQLDADYRNSMHLTSEPTPWVSGVTREYAPKSIGAAALWVLDDPQAKCGMLEFSGAGIDAQKQAIADTMERAILFGAQMFADNRRAAESGEALKLRLGSQRATLVMIARSSAAALEKVLKNIAVWGGMNPDDVQVTPNLEFVDVDLTPQEILALVSGWQSGGYSKRTLYENLQRGGIANAERSFEDEQELIASEGPGLGEIPPAVA